MAEVPVDHDVIEMVARMVLGQISPITGTRGTGEVLVANDTDDPIAVPKNMYLLPRIGSTSELADDLVYKTAANPATVTEHGEGGDWTIPPHDELAIGIQSNLGGVRHNLPAGTVFLWDPPLTGLAETCTLVDAITDAAEKTSDPVVRRAVYYEDLRPDTIAQDLHKGRLAQLPAVMLTWEQSTPAEGRTSGTNQGSTRVGDGVRIFSEHYRLFVVVAEYSSDKSRRNSGLRVLQALTRLLTDQVRTRDAEVLTVMGSLEILSRSRFSRSKDHYIYTMPFRVQRAFRRLEERTFVPWLTTHLEGSLPGREAPEPTGDLQIVDVTFPMPQE